MPAGRGEATRLTSSDGAVGSFDWFPDGSRLVYSLREDTVNLWSVQVDELLTRMATVGH